MYPYVHIFTDNYLYSKHNSSGYCDFSLSLHSAGADSGQSLGQNPLHALSFATRKHV